MAWVLPFNSYIVSGFTILFFNFFVFSAVKALCQSICASQNLHIIYDQRRALEPRRSRFSSFFGGPTGPPLLARFFAFLIAFYAVLVILLDFAVNGNTVTSHVPTVYKSIVQAHPKLTPLTIDYAREFNIDKKAVSLRLLALVEAHSCMHLNITHHAMFAYAFRDIKLDKRLVKISEFPAGGVCVTVDLFQKEQRNFIFEQIPELEFKCDLEATRIDVQPSTNKSVILNATITPKDPASCDLIFRAIQCFKTRDDIHCGIVASLRNNLPSYILIAVPNHKAPKEHNRHQLREVDNIPAEDARVLAANIAFLTAIPKFGHGLFNAMYVAISEVKYDVMLNRTVRKNVSEINIALAAPVLTIVITVTVSLGVVAITLWVRYVYRKNRRKYTSFSSVEDVLSIVRQDGLTKSKEGDPSDQVIFLHGERPVLVQENWFEY